MFLDLFVLANKFQIGRWGEPMGEGRVFLDGEPMRGGHFPRCDSSGPYVRMGELGILLVEAGFSPTLLRLARRVWKFDTSPPR